MMLTLLSWVSLPWISLVALMSWFVMLANDVLEHNVVSIL